MSCPGFPVVNQRAACFCVGESVCRSSSVSFAVASSPYFCLGCSFGSVPLFRSGTSEFLKGSKNSRRTPRCFSPLRRVAFSPVLPAGFQLIGQRNRNSVDRSSFFLLGSRSLRLDKEVMRFFNYSPGRMLKSAPPGGGFWSPNRALSTFSGRI